jgi:hypothetical protein
VFLMNPDYQKWGPATSGGGYVYTKASEWCPSQ